MLRRKIKYIAFLLMIVGIYLANAVNAELGEDSKKNKIKIDFRDVEFKEIVKFISGIKPHSFMLDDRIKGKISFVSPAPVTVEEAWEGFLAMLDFMNYSIKKGSGNSYIISPRGSYGFPLDAYEKKKVMEENKITNFRLITLIFPIKNTDLKTVKDKIKPMLSKSAQIQEYLL